MAPESLGARIAKRRKRAGLTQPQLGAKLGVEGSTVSHWETDLHDPPVAALREMRAIFSVTLDWLLCATDEPPAETVNVSQLRRAMKRIEGGVAAMTNVAAALGEMAEALPPEPAKDAKKK